MQFNRSAIAIAAASALCAATASADTLYVTSGPVSPNLQTIDPTNGSVLNSISISGEEALFGGLAWDGNNLYSIDGYNDGNSDRTFVIDPTNGTGAVVGNTNFNWNFRSVEHHPQTGKLYATTDNALYTLDKTTGAATLVANITGGGGQLDQATALAINASGQAFMTDIGSQSLFQLDLATGVLTLIGQLTVSPSTGWFQDLAFDSAGQLWGVWWQGGMYTINTTNATYALGFASGSFAGIAFRPDCNVTTYCTAKVNSLGCTPQIGTTGVPSATAGSGFFVNGVNIRNNKNGLLFYGVNGQAALPFQGGTLCVKSQVRRTPAVNSGGAPAPANDCSGVYSIDMNLFAVGGLGGNPLAALTVAGTIVNCQWWGRDPGFPAPNNTTLSNAAEYKICP